MQVFLSLQRYLVRKLKYIPRQSWVKRPDDAYIPFLQRKIEYVEVKQYCDIKIKKKDKNTSTKPTEQFIPYSPKMGPYTIQNPKIYNKTYRWCTCGQSIKQPFCDGSHQGTSFKPFKFTIEQNIKQVSLCGCKLTKNKPFCDNQSCKSQFLKLTTSTQTPIKQP